MKQARVSVDDDGIDPEVCVIEVSLKLLHCLDEASLSKVSLPKFRSQNKLSFSNYFSLTASLYGRFLTFSLVNFLVSLFNNFCYLSSFLKLFKLSTTSDMCTVHVV